MKTMPREFWKRIAEGKLAMTEVRLNVHANFSGDTLPSRPSSINYVYGHEESYIANSVKTRIEIVQA